MKKQLMLILVLVGMIWGSASAQSLYINLDYQSFRPFVHFQLHVGDQRAQYNAYQSSYVKGYLDGVNSTYYSDYRFYDLVRQINAYEAGYRDGQQDQQLFCRLHGYHRLPQRPFSYNDYYSPQIAIQIWLDDLTFTFLRAPERRLPHSWARRARPAIRRYRSRLSNHKYYAKVEKRYRNNRKQLINRARKVRYHNDARWSKHKKEHGKNRSRKLNKDEAIRHVRQNTQRHLPPKRTRTRRIGRRQPTSGHHAKSSSRHTKPARRSSTHKDHEKDIHRRRSSSRDNRAKHTRQKQKRKDAGAKSRHRSRRNRRGHNR